MHIEIAVPAAHISAQRIGEQKRVGQRRSSTANRDDIIVIHKVGVEIFHAKREIARNLDLGAAAVGITPAFRAAVIAEAIYPIGGGKAVVDLAIRCAAGGIEQRAASGITDTCPCLHRIIELAGKCVGSRGGAERGNAIARFVLAAFKDKTIDDIARLHVITGANVIFVPILVASAPTSG